MKFFKKIYAYFILKIMKNIVVLPNNYEGKTTYVVGDYVCNGCQIFHINDIDRVCKIYDVPDELKREVLEIHSSFDAEQTKKYFSRYIRLIHLLDYGFVHDYLRWSDILDCIASNDLYESDYNFLVNSKYYNVRRIMAKRGYGLEKLIKDKIDVVREEVAKQGYGLSRLIRDKNNYVRREVAIHCNENILPFLMNDKSALVRREVANRGLYLDTYIKDRDDYVRCAVAKCGYKLDVLIKDESGRVRAEVAKQGYGLDILINDDSFIVLIELIKQNYKLEILSNSTNVRISTMAKNELKMKYEQISNEENLYKQHIEEQAKELDIVEEHLTDSMHRRNISTNGGW